MSKKISIADVARELKISPTSVSFIMNGKAEEKRISKELVETVQKYIKEVGYRPNTLARSLRTGKTQIIWLMVEDIDNPFFASIARKIEEQAYKAGYKILYNSTGNQVERTKELLQMVRERNIDGCIISPPEGIEEDIMELTNAGIPVVLFDRYLANLKVPSLIIDNLEAIDKASIHLIESGFKNIGFITLQSHQTQMADRLAGYKKAMKEYRLPTHVKEMKFNQDHETNVNDIMGFLEANPSLDALVFATNYLAINGLMAIKKMGLQIPSDLAVVAFDDHDLFELYSPSITTISQPIEEISNQLMTILLTKLNHPLKDHTDKKIVLASRLIIRNSSKKVTQVLEDTFMLK